MMTDNSEIIKARGREKAALTRISKFLESEQVNDLNEIRVRLEKLEDVYNNFNKYDSALPDENSEIEEFENKYFHLKAQLRRLMTSVLPQVSTNVSSSHSDFVESPAVTQRSITDFKMPRLNIPIFSGEYMEWPSFKDLFCAVVHKNDSLSKIQKFQYLKGLLADTPASIIRHIPVTEASYEEAWDKLLLRYDKNKKIVSSLIHTFLSQPKVAYANEHSLRKLADTSDEVVRGLKALNEKATSRDPWLIYILLEKVDSETRQLWAEKHGQEDFPTLDAFLEFLSSRSFALEDSNPKQREVRVFNKPINNAKDSSSFVSKCIKCHGNHYLYKCHKFKSLDISSRKAFVYKKGLCTNCFSDKHKVKECVSTYLCYICKGKHHSLLHENVSSNHFTQIENKSDVSNCTNNITNATLAIHATSGKLGLLPTAVVSIKDNCGSFRDVTVLLDCGSQRTFISEACVQKLGLIRSNARFSVVGLAATKAGTTKGYVSLSICSKYDKSAQFSIEAYILNNLTSPLPTSIVNNHDLSHLSNLRLADPNFTIPKNIELIIGADYFFSLLLPGQIINPEDSLIAQNTKFGWVVSGKTENNTNNLEQFVSLTICDLNIDQELKRFWEVEEVFIPKDSLLTPEEQFVETHFQDNYSINSNGQFVVKLPFCKPKSELGSSKPAAISRLYAMERKFKDNPEYKTQYINFMREYLHLNHMEVISDNLQITNQEQFYLPHHAVVKPSSTTTKLRVVFDGSCSSTSGISLNSILGVGPKLQRDIFEIMLSFRFPEIVFSADIEKMYRQIVVSENDQNFQKIVWRENPGESIQTYKLKTVTYGLAPASFLATRCIKQIALDHTENPNVSRILQEDMYMDDLLSGASTVNDAVATCKEIVDILHARGFNLRKWNSNSSAFLAEFHDHCFSDTNLEITTDSNVSSKVLGLFWNSSSDIFFFKASLSLTLPLTKRLILAESARIFDPLGLISPCTVVIKIFYQKLWLLKGDWDSPIPEHLAKDWFKFQESFNEINHLTVPRCVTLISESNFELHGFSDSSTLAYSAVIYCRQVFNGKTKVSLLVSKTKVAPIKQISVPKLELCGAHLLAKLFNSVLNTLKKYQFDVFAWTDSKVVLSWLSSHPRKWKTFVANRTSQILEILPTTHWRHVPSKENPADIASRGIDPSLFANCDLWWDGPKWLQLDQSHWPSSEMNSEEINDQVKTEQKTDPSFCLHNHISNDLFDNLFEKHSSLSKIFRILAYCQRFIKNCKSSSNNQLDKTSKAPTASLTFSEIQCAKESVIRFVQQLHFHEELECIQERRVLPKKSLLRSLHPIIDKNGLLRVGGRLQNSHLEFNSKHPVILPSKHKISELLVREQHILNLHSGPTLLSHIIKQSFWIIGGKKLINKCIYKCLKCHRFKASTGSEQLMGNLPAHRVTLERPFFSCGIDYAGPISIKLSKGRGTKSTKGYVALFICFATKAVHIEAVSDLSADAFIAAFRRFSARRGAPRHIYSDNATNFVGARRKLNEMKELWLALPSDQSVLQHLAENSVEWHFIPPGSPHFGGIWEAAIRSLKYHLKRVIGDMILTFEELTTLLTQIEALLNSRPLIRVNDSDTDSINVITPSHFLTGDVVLSIPDNVIETTNSKNRWAILQSLRNGFWRRWHQEYLCSLQPRCKWQTTQPNLKVGDVVLLKDKHSPPGSWPIGRIVEVHPGKDGLVRVVTVKTARNFLKRTVAKICLLPISQD